MTLGAQFLCLSEITMDWLVVIKAKRSWQIIWAYRFGLSINVKLNQGSREEEKLYFNNLLHFISMHTVMHVIQTLCGM